MRPTLRQRPIRAHFSFIFLGTAAPLMLLTAVAVFYVGRAEFRSTQRGLEDTARALSAAVDHELGASTTTLKALATSKFIDRGDLRSLHQQVVDLLPTQPGWRTVIMHDHEGNNIFHSSFPFGTPRPKVTDPRSFGRLVETLQPLIMNYTQGPVSGPTIGARVPVIRDGKLKYVLTASIDAVRLDQIMRQQRLRPNWYAVVFDQERVQIASSTERSEANRGNKTGRLIGRFPEDADAAWIAGPNRAGVESYAAFVRAPLSGYYVGIIVPQNELSATLLNSVWIVAAMGLVAGAVGLTLLSFYGRLFRRWTGDLVGMAHTIRDGKPVEDVAPAPVKEVNFITAALSEASAALQRTRTERDRSEAELRHAKDDLARRNAELQIITDSMAAGVARLDRNERFLWVSKQLCTWLGKEPSEIVGRALRETLEADVYTTIKPHIEAVLAGRPVEFEFQRDFPGAGQRWVHIAYSPTRSPGAAVDGWVAVLIDIDERKHAEEMLDNVARFPSENPAPVLRGNALGELLYSNPAGNTFLENFSPAHHKKLPPVLSQAVAQALADGGRRELEVPCSDRLFSFLIVPVPERRYANLYGNEITDRKRAEAALRDANRRKDDFLAMLGHELRNPLSVIESSVQVLNLTGVQTEQAQEMRQTISRQTGQMATLIDDLLDVSRITRGLLRIQKEPCDLAKITQAVAADFALIAQRGGLVLETTIGQKPLWVDGDKTRLAQILSNLLSNALKFSTPPGSIHITVAAGENNRALISVRDTGVGIAADNVSDIFMPFMQAEQTLERSQGGLGLGLALVKGLVELHGGTVTVTSEGPGKGSEFVVDLPLSEPPQAPGRDEVSAAPESSRLRILVVDDNRPAAEAARIFLQLKGHEVEIARDGLEAVSAAESFRPDVVLCDIGLPGLNGYEVARRLSSELPGKKPFLVAASGYGEDENRERARLAGFDEYLIKPLNLPQLADFLAARFKPAEILLG